MKAIAINTTGTAHGNAIQFSAEDKSPRLFLEYMANKVYSVESIWLSSNKDVFTAHFYPAKLANEECAQYINANR